MTHLTGSAEETALAQEMSFAADRELALKIRRLRLAEAALIAKRYGVGEKP